MDNAGEKNLCQRLSQLLARALADKRQVSSFSFANRETNPFYASALPPSVTLKPAPPPRKAKPALSEVLEAELPKEI